MNDAESRTRRWVQRTLAVGLVASAVLLIAGAVLVFARQEGAQTSGRRSSSWRPSRVPLAATERP